MNEEISSNIAYEGLPSVRYKKVQRVADFVTEEVDFYVQDYDVVNALKSLKELLKLSSSEDKKNG